MKKTEPELLVVGIETSCDDTACAVVDGAGRVRATVVSSQLEAHRPFGGVVPEIASREHLANWPAVSREALARAAIEWRDVDAVAATRGPGLIGSLLVGLSLGKALAWGLGKPFYAVHHLEGHLYSPFMQPPGEVAAPIPDAFVGLVVSGGHTAIYRVDAGRTTTIAETRDDAMGEVFDKVGKRLAIPYPQGPRVDQLAEQGKAGSWQLPIARCRDGSLDFSYSGLKTQTLAAIRALEGRGVDTAVGDGEASAAVRDLLADFRVAAVEQVVDRLTRLDEAEPLGCVAVSGGVAANRLLRRRLELWAAERGVDLRLVPLLYAGDNAAMIAYAALGRARRGEPGDPLDAEAASRLPL